MRWFRSNRGGVAWLAFFALACQLVLSFGHVHVGKFSGGSAAWAAAESADASADAPQSSPQQKPTGLAGDFCALFANISLAHPLDRKTTRLNSSPPTIPFPPFSFKKKKLTTMHT